MLRKKNLRMKNLRMSKLKRKWKVNLMHVKKAGKAFTSDYYQLNGGTGTGEKSTRTASGGSDVVPNGTKRL